MAKLSGAFRHYEEISKISFIAQRLCFFYGTYSILVDLSLSTAWRYLEEAAPVVKTAGLHLPPHCLVLALFDSHIFGSLKDTLPGRRFTDDDEPKRNVDEELRRFSQGFHVTGIHSRDRHTASHKRWKNVWMMENLWKILFLFLLFTIPPSLRRGILFWPKLLRCLFAAGVAQRFSLLYSGSSFMTFRSYTQRRTTVGRTSLDEGPARYRDLYLTTHNTHNRQTSMPPVGFEPTVPAGERL